MAWRKGESGNLLGRPTLTPEQREALARAKKLTPFAVGNLADLATIERDDDGRITNGMIALQASMALLKTGGLLDGDGAKVEESARALVAAMLDEAQAQARVSGNEPDNGRPALEPVK